MYNGLTDALANDHINPAEQGRHVVLSVSFTGGEWFMQNLYHNAMAIVRAL